MTTIFIMYLVALDGAWSAHSVTASYTSRICRWRAVSGRCAARRGRGWTLPCANTQRSQSGQTRTMRSALHWELPACGVHKPGREMIDLLVVEEPDPKPTKIRAVSYQAGIGQLFKRTRTSSSSPSATSGQYSQGPGTQRKTSPSTATWQTDGNDR